VTFEPGPFVGLVVLALLYVRAVRVLGARGYRVPGGQQAFWWSGFALLAFAFLGPLDTWADTYVSSHMAQHMLMADIATPLMLVGLRNPVLVFFLPRPILEPLARRRTLRTAFAKLRSPMWAIPVYTVVLYLWHAAPLFEGALRHPLLHALQHESFIVFSAFLWWPIIEPGHRRMPGALWKIPYFFGARIPTMLLGMGFIVSQSPFYAGFYGHGKRPDGLSAVADQQLGGGIMMAVDVVLLMVMLALMFWRAASDDDAKAPVGEPGAEGDLAAIQQEGQVQAGVKVAEVR
jgi:cytochrome c oxidase assembly factor CtaG